MIQTIKTFLLSIGIAWIIFAVQFSVGSTYITDFLKGNLLSLLITLFAINSATIAVLLSRLSELARQHETTVSEMLPKTKNEILLSFKEQIGLIILAMVIPMLMGAQMDAYVPSGLYLTSLNIILIATFIHAIFILYDTATSIFSIP